MCNTYDHWISSWVFMAAYVNMFYHFGHFLAFKIPPPTAVGKNKIFKKQKTFPR